MNTCGNIHFCPEGCWPRRCLIAARDHPSGGSHPLLLLAGVHLGHPRGSSDQPHSGVFHLCHFITGLSYKQRLDFYFITHRGKKSHFF